ncbi:MAG: hypothetical protein HYR60_14450 [Acidobacteria bacterium]|nr:hypothetical protein [Acidobacteriota bacterium]
MNCGKYQVLDLIQDGETKSYRGRDPIAGRDVLVHLLPPQGSSEFTVIMRCMGLLSPQAARMILDEGHQDGRLYLVTEITPGFSSLVRWMEDLLIRPPQEPGTPGKPAQPGRPAPVAESKPSGKPAIGDLTRMFNPAARTPPEPVPAPVAASKPAPAKPGAGELTRMFQTPPIPDAPAAPRRRPVLPPLPPPVFQRRKPTLLPILGAAMLGAAALAAYIYFFFLKG